MNAIRGETAIARNNGKSVDERGRDNHAVCGVSMMGRQLRRLDECHIVKGENRKVETFYGNAEPFVRIKR